MKRVDRTTQPATPKFYQSYVSVIYGFVAVIGLDAMMNPGSIHIFTVMHFAMFVGTLITNLHFWLVCVTTDDLSDFIYLIAAGKSKPRLLNLLLVVDLAFATAFAAPIVLMFRTVVSNQYLFYAAFAALTLLSVVYDLLSLALASFAALRAKTAEQKNKVKEYVSIYSSWVIQDGLFLLAGIALFCLYSYFVQHSAYYAIAFLVVAIVAIGVDTMKSNPYLYLILYAAKGRYEKAEK
jgi:hypothetical protein